MADGEKLALIIPLVECVRSVDALITLQPHEIAIERKGERLGRLGLADARRAFEEQRLSQPEREEHRGRQTLVGQIALLAQPSGATPRAKPRPSLRSSVGISVTPFAACAFSARRMRSGVIGSVSTRTPTASKIALAIAGIGELARHLADALGAIGTVGGGRSSTTISISASRRGPGIRYWLKSAGRASRFGIIGLGRLVERVAHAHPGAADRSAARPFSD